MRACVVVAVHLFDIYCGRLQELLEPTNVVVVVGGVDGVVIRLDCH